MFFPFFHVTIDIVFMNRGVVFMIKILIQNFKNLDKKISHILKIGLSFSFIVCLLSAMVLLTYMLFFTYPIIYYIGILGIVLGLNFAMSFIISATIIDDVKKESL